MTPGHTYRTSYSFGPWRMTACFYAHESIDDACVNRLVKNFAEVFNALPKPWKSKLASMWKRANSPNIFIFKRLENIAEYGEGEFTFDSSFVKTLNVKVLRSVIAHEMAHACQHTYACSKQKLRDPSVEYKHDTFCEKQADHMAFGWGFGTRFAFEKYLAKHYVGWRDKKLVKRKKPLLDHRAARAARYYLKHYEQRLPGGSASPPGFLGPISKAKASRVTRTESNRV